MVRTFELSTHLPGVSLKVRLMVNDVGLSEGLDGLPWLAPVDYDMSDGICDPFFCA